MTNEWTETWRVLNGGFHLRQHVNLRYSERWRDNEGTMVHSARNKLIFLSGF